VAAIDAAQTEVFVESYIYSDDATGQRIAEALARAAARGVATHLLVDGFGTPKFSPRLRKLLADAGAELLVFRPSLLPRFLRRPRAPLRRMHRKLASIDGRLGFVGGINIIDDVDPPHAGPPRFDYAVRLEGPLATQVHLEAGKLWSRVSWASVGRRWPGFRKLRGQLADAPPVPPQPAAGTQRAALVIRDNLRRRQTIEAAYLELIGAARSEIVIANAYFFPTRRLRAALTAAARRKVEVTLLLQGRVEYLLQHYASRAHYRTLLDAGIHLREYHRSFLHAKVAVFDGRIATVGSSNIDPFSLLLAQEANVFVDDPAFASELRASVLEAGKAGGRQVSRYYWRRLSWSLKARIWICYRIARFLMASFGFDRR
jgi:cardiolipin synthase